MDLKNSFYEEKFKKTLILTNDGIGDAVIRLNLLERYADYFGYENTYFLASTNNVEVIRLISKNVIVIDRNEFKKNLSYKKNILMNLNKLTFDQIINVINRAVLYNEAIIRDVNANYKVAYEGEEIEKIGFYRKTNNENYDYIIPSIDFEKKFSVNSHGVTYILKHETKIFNNITNSNLELLEAKTDLKKYLIKNIRYDIERPYIVFGMGASQKGRMYPVEKLVKVIEDLDNEKMVFLGKGLMDEEYYDNVISNLSKCNNIINLTSKLNLSESFEVIKNSTMFIGVESGLWNAAYALDVPSIVIYGGGHWGRFMHNDKKTRYVYKKMKCYFCRWKCEFQDSYEYYKCISEIPADEIIENIKMLSLL